MQDKANKEFIIRINSNSIYWSSRYAKKDASRFVIMEGSKQVADTGNLYNAVVQCLNKKATALQKKSFIAKAKKFDPESVSLFERKV